MLIQFKNWEEYNPRSDYKNPVWFRMNAGIIQHDLWDELSGDEFKCFTALLAVATPKFGIVDQRPSTFLRLTAINSKVFSSTIKKLESLQVIHPICTDSVQQTNGSVQNLFATYERTNERTSVSDTSALHWLGLLWNENRGSLKQVKEISVKRRNAIKSRLDECSDRDVWLQVIKKLAASKFCNGKVPGKTWKADFDFLLKPDTRIKALEGKYDGDEIEHTEIVVKGTTA